MAVPGKKLSDFSGSINVRPTEAFDHNCEPCMTAGHHIEAHGYCLDCREYLCNNCFTYHLRSKASKNHQLLDKDDIDKKGIPKPRSEVCSEKCHKHTDEVIKFFCLQHEELACHDCVALNHRSCDLDYIPHKCADIEDSEEFKRIAWLLSKRLAEVNYVIKKATNRREEIDTHNEDLIKGIDKFQQDVNDRIQQIRKEIQTEIDKKDSLNKHTVDDVLDSCTTISSDISKIQTKLQESKTTKQNGRLYIAIKQAASKLKADNIMKFEEELDKTRLQNTFDPNPDLQALLSKQEGFGKLSLSKTLVTQSKKVKLTEKRDINIRTESDELPCSISGCAVLSSNKIILADGANNKLKVLDKESNLIIVEKKLDAHPWDVTTFPQDQIAVTLPDEGVILVLTTDNKLSTVHITHVRGECRGITYHQDHLYTVCTDPNAVVILNTEGIVHNTISLNTGHLKVPYSIVVREDSKLMYISYPESECIVSITSQGEISAVYKDHLRPTGMTALDDGSLLVCRFGGTIRHFTADMKQVREFLHFLQIPFSICYNHQQHYVYIGGHEYDKLNMLSLAYI